MKQIERLLDFISKNVLRCVFLLIFIFSLFIKAMYSFLDAPYFAVTNMIDIGMGICVAFIFIFIYRKRRWIQEHINYKICFCIFSVFAILFIWLVPLTPFSDMEAIYKGAIFFSQFCWEDLLRMEYWTVFPGNIRLAIFWGVLLIPLPKNVVSIKIVNAFLVYVIAVLTRKLAKEVGIKYYNIVYCLMLGFVPMFLYINHVYFDIPLIVLCLLGIYIYIHYNNLILSFLILGFAYFLRVNISIFIAAIAIVYLSRNKEEMCKKKWFKCIGKLIIAVCLFLVVNKGLVNLTQEQLIQDDIKSYPLWNQIYIGINEEEFGFMDGDFSYDRSAQDVINRIKEYGALRFVKILVKKTFWLWSQGTYQAQRYAFGNDVVDWSQKFEYETPITSFLLNDEQIVRKLLNSFMRAQYLLLFGLMIISLYKIKNIDKFRIFYYIIIATFLVMIVYELKSRYILQLCPMMVILAGNTIEIFENRRKANVQTDD